ncbi:MAG TPA: hypothetical protein VK578_16510 [Edaphobacter sp.]|nr:hypothetical protein [Edaphobacter sp.]
MAPRLRLEQSLQIRQNPSKGPALRYREYEEDVHGLTVKHRIAEIHASSMKRLSKVESADDPSDGADDE